MLAAIKIGERPLTTPVHRSNIPRWPPGHNESAGKRHSGKTRKGNRYLRAALIQTGLSATRKNGSALQARYHRVKRHRGHKKAVVAVGHQILEIAFYIMRDGSPTKSWGPTTSIADTPNGRLADTSVNLKPWDSASRSKERHDSNLGMTRGTFSEQPFARSRWRVRRTRRVSCYVFSINRLRQKGPVWRRATRGRAKQASQFGAGR